MKLLLPREHGAWGILLVPFLSAVAVAGEFSVAAVVALLLVLAAFLARFPLELLLLRGPGARPAGRSPTALARWALGYSLLAAVLGLFLVVARGLSLLLVLGVLASALFALHVRVARNQRRQGAATDLLGTAGLTLSAPVGWVAATGGLDATGALVWLLNLVFFGCGVLYVRARIRQRPARSASGLAAPARLSLGAHLAVAGFVLALVYGQQASPWVAVPFLAAAGRAAWGARRPSFNLRRLGWSEMALSVLFAGCLALGFRL